MCVCVGVGVGVGVGVCVCVCVCMLCLCASMCVECVHVCMFAVEWEIGTTCSAKYGSKMKLYIGWRYEHTDYIKGVR